MEGQGEGRKKLYEGNLGIIHIGETKEGIKGGKFSEVSRQPMLYCVTETR